MSEQDKNQDQDEREEQSEDTEGHALGGGPRPPAVPGTGDETRGDEDDKDWIIPTRIIPKR